MTGRGLLLVALVWVLTVAGASTLTWTVISTAGAEVAGPVTVAVAPQPEPPPARPTKTTQTWSGRAGRVTAGCKGETVSLVTAVPNVGYWVKVYDPGPDQLRVDFEATDDDRDDDDPGEVRLRAACSDGSPVFQRG